MYLCVYAAVIATAYHHVINNMWGSYVNTVEFLSLHKFYICASALSLSGKTSCQGQGWYVEFKEISSLKKLRSLTLNIEEGTSFPLKKCLTI